MDSSHVDPLWLDSDFGDYEAQPSGVEFVQYEVKPALSSKENSGFCALINAAALLDDAKKRLSGTPLPYALTHMDYFEHEQSAWASQVLKKRVESHCRYLSSQLDVSLAENVFPITN